MHQGSVDLSLGLPGEKACRVFRQLADYPLARFAGAPGAVGSDDQARNIGSQQRVTAVSYTHLTLPTIYSV